MENNINLNSLQNVLGNMVISSNGKSSLPHVDKNNKEKQDANVVLAKVKADIQLIKHNVLSSISNGEPIDYNDVKRLFEKAENNIQTKKEDLNKQLFNQAAVIEPEKLFTNVIGTTGVTKERRSSTSVAEEEKPVLPPLLKTVGSPVKKLKVNQPSPGQKLLALQKLKSIINPARTDTRAILHKHYGVPLPCKIDQKDDLNKSVRANHPVTGSTLSHPHSAPLRESGRFTPPPLAPDDSKRGVINLIERKIIPAASYLSITPSPIKQKPAVLHQPSVKSVKPANSERPIYNMALVKFDESALESEVDLVKKKRTSGPGADNDSFVMSNSKVSHGPMSTDVSQISLQQPNTTVANSNEMSQMLVPVPTPALDSSQRPMHKFVIQNGRARSTSEDFLRFKQYYCLSWGSIVLFMQRLERLLIDYSIPVAFINGDRLADLSLFFEVGPKPTIKDLLMCVLNSEDVERLIVIPGRRYLAPDGDQYAAIKIQSVWRRYKKHSAYLQYRRRKWAAGIIALTWIMKCKLTMIREDMKESQQEYLKKFRKRAKILSYSPKSKKTWFPDTHRNQVFRENWTKLKNSKRLIIHIPSLDPNVDVIYICPVKATDEFVEYYMKLINIICSVNNLSYEQVKEKIKFITPEHFDKFPDHNLCLSSLLKFSTKTIKRLKKLIKGKNAYIVPGMINTNDDLFLANDLGLPVLGTEPELAQLYSMKSGVRRIFQGANVAYPPGEFDIYSLQSIHEELARLVTENLHVKRWLFKIDNQFDGRGNAYCDVTPHLASYQSALKEQGRYGQEEWRKKWANETIYNLILKEIPSIIDTYATPVDTNAFPNWQIFLENFLKQGGVIEACPPSDSVTGLTANVLIEPDGNIEILSVSDQLHSTSPYKCWGHTLPQTSIESDVINKSVLAISHACKERGIIGYISTDFVTFIDPKTDSQELWAVGLNIGYSNNLAMVKLLTAVTNGHLDVNQNKFHIITNNTIQNNVVYRSKRRKPEPSNELLIEKRERYAVLSTNLWHTNLNNVHYSVFFQICKARGIGYDEKMKLGTTFCLFDYIRRESMGMLAVGENLHDAITTFALNLSILHTDISSLNMPGRNNFQGAIKDLKDILETLKANSEIDHEKYPTSNPIQERQPSRGSDKTPSKMSSQHQVTTAENSRVATALGFRESFLNASINRSSSMNINNDNRFPSSPVSNTDFDVLE